MKILLLLINIIVFIFSGFFFVLALGIGTATDPVFRGTLVMTLFSLVGIIGMFFTYKRISRIAFFVFAIVGIGIPAVLFQVLSTIYSN